MSAPTTLGLDPSSTRTGYAVMNGPTPLDLVEAGYICGGGREVAAVDRVQQMIRDLGDLLATHAVKQIVVEVPSGKVGVGHRRGAGASLAIYGLAVGAMLGYLWATADADEEGLDRVIHVDERTWTRCKPKAVRQRRIIAEFPQYAAKVQRDGGGDIAECERRWVLPRGRGPALHAMIGRDFYVLGVFFLVINRRTQGPIRLSFLDGSDAERIRAMLESWPLFATVCPAFWEDDEDSPGFAVLIGNEQMFVAATEPRTGPGYRPN